MIKKSWLFCQILNTKNKIWSPSDYVSNFYVDWLEKEGLIHNIFICFENAFAKRSPESLWGKHSWKSEPSLQYIKS